jgi:hypothetical protein
MTLNRGGSGQTECCRRLRELRSPKLTLNRLPAAPLRKLCWISFSNTGIWSCWRLVTGSCALIKMRV